MTGRPRAARQVPGGSSRGVNATSRPSARSRQSRCAASHPATAHCPSAAPTLTASATNSPGRGGRSPADVRTGAGAGVAVRRSSTITASAGSAVSAASPKKTTRQDHQAATSPATGGPASDGMIQLVLINDSTRGRRWSG